MFAIRYYEIKYLPDLKIGEEIESIYQKALQGMGEDTPHTRLKYLGKSEHDLFDKYLIIHERPVDIYGRYKNQPIRYYIAEEEVEVFKHIEAPFVIAKGCKQVVLEAFEMLKVDKKIDFVHYEVDILSLKKDLQEGNVKGAWFRELNQANVEVAGIFGASVDQSDLWSELKSTGKLTAILIEHNRNSFMVTREGVILIYRPWSEKRSLEEVMEILPVIKNYFIV